MPEPARRRDTPRRRGAGRAPVLLSDVGEEELVASLCRGLPLGADVLVGPGDDCAVLAAPPGHPPLLFKTDCVVEGVHFTRDTPPSKAGRKALCRALSDVAAMAGTPSAAVVTLVLPPDREARWVRSLYTGLRAAARRWGVSLVGGETASTGRPDAPASVSVALLGQAGPGGAVTRSGASPGEAVFVTGRLGGSFTSGRHLRFTPRLDEAAWIAKRLDPTAMMDLSDGLARDLPRLARASGVGFELDVAAVPRHRGCTTTQALADGEDYELLFTLATPPAPRQLTAWHRAFPKVPLTRIGTTTNRSARHPGLPAGWEHFRKA